MAGGHMGDFDFAQPRLQARHAALIAPDRWAELEQIGDFGQFLQSVRATPLASLVESFGVLSPVDEMETSLRAAFAIRAEEAASWLPDEWQPPVLWVRSLPEMPPRRPLRTGTQSGRAAEGSAEWLDRWQALWPIETPGLTQIGQWLAAAVWPDFGNGAAWPERRADLSGKLRRAFRRHAFGPGAAFAHLGLVCLELGRLRGNLTARRARLIV